MYNVSIGPTPSTPPARQGPFVPAVAVADSRLGVYLL